MNKPIGRILDEFHITKITNIEKPNGSWVIYRDNLESALNLYINQEMLKLIGADEDLGKYPNYPGADYQPRVRNQLRKELRQSVNNRGGAE